MEGVRGNDASGIRSVTGESIQYSKDERSKANFGSRSFV